MFRFSLLLGLTALIRIASAAFVPHDIAGTDVEARSISDAIRLEVVAKNGEDQDVTGLYLTQYHSGAGLNNLIGLPISISTLFYYDPEHHSIYQNYSDTDTSYVYALELENFRPYAMGLTDYHIVSFDLQNRTNDHGFILDSSRQLQLGNAPPTFGGFALCSVKEISEDELESSEYQQLLWRTKSANSGKHTCVDVDLIQTDEYGQ